MGLVAVFAFFMPSMRGDDSEDIDRDQILMMQKLLNAAAEREQEERQDQEVTETAPDQKEGGTGTRAKGEEGSMGNPNTKDTVTSTESRVRRTTRIRTSRSRPPSKRPRSSA
jgi:hypothetical protein